MPLSLLHYSDIENAYDDPARIGRLAGLLDTLRDSSTIVVGSGDNTAPGVTSLVHEGRQALDFFDAVAPAADTFGNHDFDYGPAATLDIVRRSPQTWVSANVRRDGDPFGRDAGVVPATVVERGGHRVGLVGVTDPATGSMCPGASELTFTDPATAVEREADRLRATGVDSVVVLSHLGAGDEELARETDVDAILGGHVHDHRVTDVAGTVLTRPDANGHRVLELDLTTGTVTEHSVADAPCAEPARAALERRRAAMDLDDVVGHAEEPIQRDGERTGAGECRVGNFVADAYRWAADADVALQNTGGIREGPPLSGAVTVADLASLIPFDEPVTVAEVTGAELRTLAQQADGNHLDPVPNRWHAHVSGVSITQHEDGRVTVRRDGDPVADDETYRLATSDYLFYTDHEFPVLTETHRVRSLATQYEVLAEYARECGIDPQIEGRVQRSGPGESRNVDTEGGKHVE